MNWKLSDRIEKIIDANVKEIPFEGKDVNKSDMKDSLGTLIEDTSIGFLTWLFANKVTHEVAKGYFFDNKYWGRRDLFNEYLKTI